MPRRGADSGRFVRFGADGRGGTTKVLKVGGSRSQQSSAQVISQLDTLSACVANLTLC